jgi:integrase
MEEAKVRFPKIIANKKTKASATIYGKIKGGEPKPDGGVTQPYPFYRVCWKVAGQRKMQSFATYSAAKRHADEMVKDLGKGSQITALTPGQARDALAAFERLDGFHKSTGKRVSLNSAVADYVEVAGRLPKGVSFSDAFTGYLNNVATVTRKDLGEAVAEFVAARAAKTKAPDGQRAQLSSGYAYLVALWLGWFAKQFLATAVCDLTKDHVDAFMANHGHLAAKSKNHLRATLRMFLGWCAKRDYLSATHRLLEAPSMERETVTPGDTEFYRPAEFRKLLEAADATMRPIIALQGLAGLRQQEALRLTWQDVFSAAGNVTISATKSKTRSRRLVEIMPALAQWLESYRHHEGPLWILGVDMWQENFKALREKEKIPARKNGLRHSFCTYHFALHANENLTAQQAGNSPAMIHQHYKGLATKAEAEKWFSVAPEQAANFIQLAEHKIVQ